MPQKIFIQRFSLMDTQSLCTTKKTSIFCLSHPVVSFIDFFSCLFCHYVSYRISYTKKNISRYENLMLIQDILLPEYYQKNVSFMFFVDKKLSYFCYFYVLLSVYVFLLYLRKKHLQTIETQIEQNKTYSAVHVFFLFIYYYCRKIHYIQ